MLLLLDPSKLPPPDPPAIVRFEFSESERPRLLSLSSLLYDLELVHDLSVIVMYDEYDTRALVTPFFYYRKGRGIAPEHMVRAAGITKQSHSKLPRSQLKVRSSSPKTTRSFVASQVA